jgi:serine/threonine protein kinase
VTQTAGVVCERCHWTLAPGEVMCSRCGADAPGSTADSGRRMSIRDKLTQTLETQLLGTIRTVVAGEYDILGRLGKGGMCAVYLAQDLQLNRRVAIKVVLPELVSEFGIAQRRLKREARTAASLSHPNIIPVYAVREVNDLVFFVMKHIEGRTLSSAIKERGALPVPTAVSIFRQLASGLEYAHRRGVIHRDIKPANIMLDCEGWAVLTDFGIAKVSDGQEITATGAAIGTPCYMSPEQCSGVTATMASDQYSLGIVAYEMLTGNPPFLGDSVAAVITKHLFETAPPLDEVVPDCPRQVSEVIERMLAKNPDDRWPSMTEAVEALGAESADEAETGRASLIDLAISAPGASGELEYSTPRSPLAIKTSGRRRTPGVRRRSKLRRWITQRSTVALGVAAASLILSLAVVWSSRSTESSIPAPSLVEQQQAELLQPNGETPAAQSDQALAIADTQSATTAATAPRQNPAVPDRSADTQVAHPVQAPAQVPAAPAPPRDGEVQLGTRGVAAVLYVNGEPRGVIEWLQWWSIPAGTVTLSIQKDGCTPWDSTVVVRPGTRTTIGYRTPSCPL